MEIQVGVAKISKWAVRESGDTLEVIERPHGGLSIVLADGQGSGQAAKDLSNLVAKKAIALLADGVRDGAVARAVHDFLFHYRHGRVSATLNILSVDLVSRTVVVSRNNPCPVAVAQDGEVHLLDDPSLPIGMHRRMKPVVTERPIAAGARIIMFTDGIQTAGGYGSAKLDVRGEILRLLRDTDGSASALADGLLGAAIALDRGRPNDDMSVVALAILAREHDEMTRRMWISFPVE